MTPYTLILLMGLPRSGKSTVARKLNKHKGWPIVNPDAIRLAMHGEAYIQQAEPWVWTFAKTMAVALFRAGHDTVIVDATNTSVKRREFWHEGMPAVIRTLWVKETRDICVARAGNNAALVETIERMHGNFESPLGAEAVTTYEEALQL